MGRALYLECVSGKDILGIYKGPKTGENGSLVIVSAVCVGNVEG